MWIQICIVNSLFATLLDCSEFIYQYTSNNYDGPRTRWKNTKGELTKSADNNVKIEFRTVRRELLKKNTLYCTHIGRSSSFSGKDLFLSILIYTRTQLFFERDKNLCKNIEAVVERSTFRFSHRNLLKTLCGDNISTFVLAPEYIRENSRGPPRYSVIYIYSIQT